MKLIACLPARNEDWILGFSARVALLWADSLVLLDHASADRTPEIICELQREYGSRVIAMRVDDEKWDEMNHRQAMLCAARQAGATHVAITDADEVVSSNLSVGDGACIKEWASQLCAGQIMSLPGYNLRGGLYQYHANGLWGNRWFSVAFADDARLGWRGDRFHAREPEGLPQPLQPYRPIQQGQGGIMHLWGASERRLRAKHAAYQVHERLRWPLRSPEMIRQMYCQWRSPKDVTPPRVDPAWDYAAVPREWWKDYGHLMHHIRIENEPWHEAWVRDMVREHGAAHFRGLDLFGIA